MYRQYNYFVEFKNTHYVLKYRAAKKATTSILVESPRIFYLWINDIKTPKLKFRPK